MKKPKNSRRLAGHIPIHSFYTSPGVREVITPKEFKWALRHHRLLDRLPCSFRTDEGEPFCVVSTADLSKTLFYLPREREQFLRGLELRELTEATIAM
jgi:hypothetical protein